MLQVRYRLLTFFFHGFLLELELILILLHVNYFNVLFEIVGRRWLAAVFDVPGMQL